MSRSSSFIDLGVKNAGIPPGVLILACRIRKRQRSGADLDTFLAVRLDVRAADVVNGLRAGLPDVQNGVRILEQLERDLFQFVVGDVAVGLPLPNDFPEMRVVQSEAETIDEGVVRNEFHLT